MAVAGASLITAGIVYLLAAVSLSSRQHIVIGAALTTVGTTVAINTMGLDPVAVVAVALTGGALLTAGLIQILLGATHQHPKTSTG